MNSITELGQLLRLVKNLRGVIYAATVDDIGPYIQWVRRKFQYRTIGYTPLSQEKFRCSGADQLLQKKPFQLLLPPPEPMASLIKICQQAVPEPDLIEVLFLSSLYIAPVLLLGGESARQAAQFSLYVQEASPQSDAEAKRHLRILDYAIVDAHADSSHRAVEALSRAGRYLSESKLSVAKQSISTAIKQESQFAREDCNKRFWRLIESRRENASPMVLYLHPLCALRRVLNDKDKAARVAELLSGSAFAFGPCLSVLPAFVVRAV